MKAPGASARRGRRRLLLLLPHRRRAARSAFGDIGRRWRPRQRFSLTAQARPAMARGARCFGAAAHQPQRRWADDARLILAHQRAAAGGTGRASEPPVDRLGRGESVARARGCARGRARHGFRGRRSVRPVPSHLRLHRSSAGAAVQPSRPRRGGPARPRPVGVIGI